MSRFILFCVFVGIGYLMWNHLRVTDPGLRMEGDQIVMDTDDFEVRFSRTEPISESFMVFGGMNKQLKNSLSHVTLAGLPLHHAVSIQRSHPDFHQCKSPGARQAQQLIETLNFVGETKSAKRNLIDVVDTHEDRVNGGGARTCVTITGARLEIASVQLKANGMDITKDVAPRFGHSSFYLASYVDVPDCQSLMH
jgi:hypothetical protein